MPDDAPHHPGNRTPLAGGSRRWPTGDLQRRRCPQPTRRQSRPNHRPPPRRSRRPRPPGRSVGSPRHQIRPRMHPSRHSQRRGSGRRPGPRRNRAVALARSRHLGRGSTSKPPGRKCRPPAGLRTGPLIPVSLPPLRTASSNPSDGPPLHSLRERRRRRFFRPPSG